MSNDSKKTGVISISQDENQPALSVSDSVLKSQIDGVDKSTSNDVSAAQKEINGPKGLEPTRYGDWESKGRCYDF